MQQKSAQGYTLVEVLVAAMLFGVTALVAMTLVRSFYQQNAEIQANIESETVLMMATLNLQKALSSAGSMTVTAGSLNGTNIAAGGVGQIRDYPFASLPTGSSAGGIDTVALFLRDVGGATTPPQSSLLPTGIYFARPTRTTSGVLFITSSTTGTLTPSYSDPYFDKVVEFGLTNFYTVPDPLVPGNTILTSVEATITVRRFLSANMEDWSFCPADDIRNDVGGCGGTDVATFRDLSLTTRITLSNQIIATSSGRNSLPDEPYERTFGSLYLFPQR